MEAVKSSIWGNIVMKAVVSSIWGNIFMEAVKKIYVWYHCYGSI